MQIAILLYEGLTALDAVGPYEVLSRLPETSLRFVARQSGLKRTDTAGALALNADYSLEDVPHPDILVIPGGMAGTFAAAKDQLVLSWIQAAHATSQWTTSVCSGALLLGAAGLLKGLTATTHWAAQAALEQYGATYLPERFIQHGKLITAAGVSAGIDMAFYLAAQIAGPEMARAIQLEIEYDPQPPFDAGSLQKASQTTIDLTRQLLQQQAAQEQARMAQRAHKS
ncbi:DJ-1/PfpI family protein [Ktedonosporobacter rubrisoli]|uniref:DJ-1/PfpI family protein n=1 Tax=Ktedonosporobacter rubrisoli TaxID=2509675 RepID=A0A4P6JMU7_KTERU|nr:DJ-1/PfpI family protein [Ktedonosporobacter rubrisoli]QBD76390.1 DJ-1/PfpI family protein [Ktedonosporobacter rubrisoli]